MLPFAITINMSFPLSVSPTIIEAIKKLIIMGSVIITEAIKKLTVIVNLMAIKGD